MREVYLSERECGVLILFTERFEGTRNEIRMMDAALDVVDPRYALSGQMRQTDMGVMIDIKSLSNNETKLKFDDAPFELLLKFLKEQRLPYSRRPDTVGRTVMKVIEKLEGAEQISVTSQTREDSVAIQR